MAIRRCMGCMSTYEAIDEMCPFCGYIEGTPAKEAYHIKPGSLLHDRYTVGRAIGFGGFGITYIAWDNKLMQKVAIKEYMPSEYATRVPGNLTVTIYDGERYTEFMTGLQKFLDEAKRLAKFQNVPGIVRILDSFSENLTAYIVMEYLDGMTLKQYLAEHGGKLPYEEAVEFILPVLAALQAVHKEGIIHRDISPDNIFITEDGEVKLLDFGAARYASTGYSKSLSVILKPGYAPAEQYLSHGEQGPWSDVYATAATLYRMITGVVPEEALERKEKDTLKPPSALGAKLPKNAEKAILNALNVRVENRTASAEEFEAQLLSTANVIRVTEKGEKRFNAKMPLWMRASLIAAAGLAAVCIVLFATGVLKLGVGNRLIFSSTLFDGGDVNTPGVINLTQEEGSDAAARQGMTFYVMGAYESTTAARGIIMSQDPAPGTKVPAGSRLKVEVSTGPQYALIPDIIDTLWVDSEAKITSAGFIPKIFYENNNLVPEGAVISLGHPAGENFQIGEKLKVVVSQGPDGELTKTPVNMPNIAGMDYAEAKGLLNKNGLRVIRENDQYSMTVPKGEVIAQSTSAGKRLMTGDIVYVSISMGVEQTNVPNVQYLERQNAISALQSAKLNYTVKEEESDTVREGLVIQQSVEAGSIVDVKTNVIITVSLGKLADMPSLVGTTLNKARSEMAALGFENVTYTGKYDAYTAENVIMTQSVPAGRRINVEEHIEIVYSMGKMPVNITLDANGGSVSKTSLTVYYPDTYGSLPTPAKGGYMFQGWFSATLQSVVTSNSTVPEAESDVLTALWEPISISLSKSNISLLIGDNATLSATTYPDNVNVEWSSSNTSVATVNSSGQVQTVGKGYSVITAKFTYDGRTFSDTCQIKVEGITITIYPTSLSMLVGETRRIELMSSSMKNSQLTWSSADNSVVIIESSDGDGITISGVGAGSTTVTASYVASGKTYSESCSVVVVDDITPPVLTLSASHILEGESFTAYWTSAAHDAHYYIEYEGYSIYEGFECYESGMSGETKTLSKSWGSSLSAGEYTIRIVAYNDSGRVRSNDANLIIT